MSASNPPGDHTLPADPSDGRGDGPPSEVPVDELTFAVHDLGRERPVGEPARDLGFVAATRAAEPAQPVPAVREDGFVIHQPQGVAPAAPVDALVVGAPEPVAAEDEPMAPHTSFRIGSVATAAAASATAEELWTTREPAPVRAAPATSRRGWSTRHSIVVDRSAQATMLRLREEAVNVTWKAAWLAVTSADPRLLRKRRSSAR